MQFLGQIEFVLFNDPKKLHNSSLFVARKFTLIF